MAIETAADPFLILTLAVMIATLGAIIYVLRYIVLMEKRIERIEMNIQAMVGKVIGEEYRIEERLGIPRRSTTTSKKKR